MKGFVNKKRRLRTAFIGLLALVALILVACGGSSASSSSTPTPDNSVKFFEQTVEAQGSTTVPSPTMMPTPLTHLKPGQTAELAGWEISVGDIFPVATSMEHSLVVTIGITNSSSVAQYEDSSTDWSLTDGKGNTYQQLSTADVQQRGSALPVGNVEPGSTVSGMIVFTVAKPTGQFILTFSKGGLTASWDITV